jgi:hypothetical protein
MVSPHPQRTKIFVSYSHADSPWLERLKVHLKPLGLKGALDVWDDARIAAGALWREEIDRALAEARVAVLMVSADFLASDFISEVELPALLDSARAGGTEILILVLSPSVFSGVEGLSKYQTVNDPKEPLIDMSKARQEAVFVVTATLAGAAFRRAAHRTGTAAGAETGTQDNFVADCHDYAYIFDIHIRRAQRNVPRDYAAVVASPLFGLALVLAALLMLDIKQYPAVVPLMVAVAAVAFYASYALWKKVDNASRAIEYTKYMRDRFEGCERWSAGELRENIQLAIEFLRGGMLNP